MPNLQIELTKVEMLGLLFLHCLTVWTTQFLETEDLKFILLKLREFMSCLTCLKKLMLVFRGWFFHQSVLYCKTEKSLNTLLNGIPKRLQLMLHSYWLNSIIRMIKDLELIIVKESSKVLQDRFSPKLHMKSENHHPRIKAIKQLKVKNIWNLFILKDLQFHKQVLQQKVSNDWDRLLKRHRKPKRSPSLQSWQQIP